MATGGELKSRKGLTLPGVAVDLPPLGERDIEHIRFAAEQGCDFIAASFVRRAYHIQAVKDVIADSGSTMQVIAKVESEEGVRNIDEIIAAADGIMVARGDLGIELPLKKYHWYKNVDKKVQGCRQTGNHSHADVGFHGAQSTSHSS